MKWALELNGVLQERRFDGPAEASGWAAMMWPDVPEVILKDAAAEDTAGWLVVAVLPDELC